IDPGSVPTVAAEDLPKFGRTEVVKVNVRLKGAEAEEVAQTLQRTMSSFGSAIAIPPVNQLVLVDKVSSMQELLKTIKLMEDEGEASQQLTHQCKFIKARDAEKILREQLGAANPQAEQEGDGAQGPPQFGRGGRGRGGQFGGGFGGGGGQFGGGFFGGQQF